MTTSMTRTRASASLAAAAALAGSVLSGTLAAPIAQASDPEVINTVKRDRAITPCPPLVYSPVLEAAAQANARSTTEEALELAIARSVPPGNYDGQTVGFLGGGDPVAAATTEAYKNGAANAISNCDFTEFGVGFTRNDATEFDVVAIVFGAPAPKPAEAPEPAEAPNPADPVAVPAPDPAPAPAPDEVVPTDAIRLSFDRGVVTWTANVTSTADIPGECTYVATNAIDPGLLPWDESFDIGPKGSASFSVPAPPLLSTYRVVVACSGTFEGQTVEFGRVEQDVP